MCLALAGGAAQQFQSGTIVQGGMSNALAAAGSPIANPFAGCFRGMAGSVPCSP
jgi:hypothetical protein